MSSSRETKIKVKEGELESAQFHIIAYVDNREEEFQLDTGSTYTSVSHTSHTAKYEVSGTKNRTSASGKTRKEEKIRLGSFRVGPKENSKFEVIRYKANDSQENRLGMDALAETILHFDLKNWTLAFNGQIPTQLSRQDLILFENGLFGFDSKIGGETVRFLWDTGAELSVVDRDFVALHQELFVFIQKIDNGVDATGEAVAFDLYRTQIDIGGSSCSTLIMAMDFKMIREKVGSTIRAILGTNTMRGRRWFFNFKDKSWAIE